MGQYFATLTGHQSNEGDPWLKAGTDLVSAGPCSEKMWGPSLIYEYRPTEFTRHAQ